MRSLRRKRAPVLWWVAGADTDILADCPRGDQIFVQHLGISLIGAFLFVFLISTASFFAAFPDTSTSIAGKILAPTFAFLIAMMVFLIDRLFIQSDWDWQASRQRKELAQATWEKASLEERLAIKALGTDWKNHAKRLLVISSRIMLSAAIGWTVASFMELVIYKDEIRTTIQKLHYEENKQIYNEINSRTALLDQDIDKSRAERNRLLVLKADADLELNKIELRPPPLPSDKAVAELDAQIADLRNKIAKEEGDVRRYNEDMIAEMRGTLINTWNSGVEGYGPRYRTAADLKSLSETTIARYRGNIEAIEAEKKRAASKKDAEYNEAQKRDDTKKSELKTPCLATRLKRNPPCTAGKSCSAHDLNQLSSCLLVVCSVTTTVGEAYLVRTIG